MATATHKIQAPPVMLVTSGVIAILGVSIRAGKQAVSETVLSVYVLTELEVEDRENRRRTMELSGASRTEIGGVIIDRWARM